jgi:hypothetical protein
MAHYFYFPSGAGLFLYGVHKLVSVAQDAAMQRVDLQDDDSLRAFIAALSAQPANTSVWASFTGFAHLDRNVGILDSAGSPQILIEEKTEVVQEAWLQEREGGPRTPWQRRRLLSEALRSCFAWGLGSHDSPSPAPPAVSVAVDAKGITDLYRQSSMVRECMREGPSTMTPTPPSLVQSFLDLLNGSIEKGRVLTHNVLSPGTLLTMVGSATLSMTGEGGVRVSLGPRSLFPMAMYLGRGSPTSIQLGGRALLGTIVVGLSCALLWSGYKSLMDGGGNGGGIPDGPTPQSVFLGGDVPDILATDGVNPCAICWENAPCVVIEPCGHLSMCGTCTRTLLRMGGGCPVCRGRIHKALRVFAT